MTRLLGPDPSTRRAWKFTPGRTVEGLPGKTITVYADEACTTLASIALYDPNTPETPGAEIPDSTMKIDQDSMVPLFWYPDTVKLLWAKTRDGHKLVLSADGSDIVADGGETPFGAQAKANAAQAAAVSLSAQRASNLSDLASAPSARTNLGLGGAAVLDVGSTPGTVAAGNAPAAVQAAAVQRANHTGTQSADTLTDGTTNKAFLATERTRLAGVAAGATVNSPDADLRDRGTHTGTQPYTTVTGLGGAATLNVGTSAGTVAAGVAPAAAQAAAIAASAQRSANLSDLANAGTARTNLGLGGGATLSVGATAGTLAAGDDSRITGAAQKGDAYINVRDAPYSAAGNGTTDDTAALTAAQTAASSANKRVYVPPGTYLHTGFSITVPWFGSHITKSILHGPQITASTSNVTISDLKIVSSDPTALISAHCTDIRLLRVAFSHDVGVTNHLAWDPYDVDRMRVIDCIFGIGGLQLSGCDDFLIEGNFWDCQYANVNEPCHISGQSSGVFTANTVTNTATDAVDLYSSGHRCVISNNRFIGLRGGSGLECKVTMSENPGNSSGPGNVLDSTVIANNVFRDFNCSTTSTRAGIFAAYVDSRITPAFAVNETNRGIIITGNVMTDFNATDPGNGAIVSYQGIVYHGHNGLVANNVVRNMRAWNAASAVGVALFCETADVTAGRKIVGAAVRGNHFAGIEGGAGIRCGTITNGSINDNTVRGDDVNDTNTKFGIDVVAGATLTNVTINNNQLNCSSYSTGMGIRAAATAVLTRCTVAGNVIKDCGVALTGAVQYSAFTGNVFDNAANNAGFSVGVSGTSGRGNTFTGNHITMGNGYGLVLTDLDGFSVIGSSFYNTNYGIILIGNTRHGTINNNISITQSGSSITPVRFSGVSANDTATTHVGTGNYVLNGSTLISAQITSVIGSSAWLIDSVSNLTYTSVTRNGNGAPTTATVVWPDGTGGTFTTDTLSTAFPGAVDAYHVTYVGATTKTVTQSAVTRDSTSGLITAQPALAVT